MVEFDQCDDCERLIDEYLCKFCFCLGVHSRVFIFILCLFFYLQRWCSREYWWEESSSFKKKLWVGEKLSYDPKSHSSSLLIKGKKRHVKRDTILSLKPIKILNIKEVKGISSPVKGHKGKGVHPLVTAKLDDDDVVDNGGSLIRVTTFGAPSKSTMTPSLWNMDFWCKELCSDQLNLFVDSQMTTRWLVN